MLCITHSRHKHQCIVYAWWNKSSTSHCKNKYGVLRGPLNDVNINQRSEAYSFFTCIFLAATKQLYEWFSLSVCPSVCPSVCSSVCPSHLFHYVPIIVSSWNFQELLPMTEVMSMQKVKVRGQRSRSQRSKPHLTVSGLWFQFEFTYDNEMMHKAWYCIGDVPYCFSRPSVKIQGHTAKKQSSILTQIGRFRTVTQWLPNDAQSLK